MEISDLEDNHTGTCNVDKCFTDTIKTWLRTTLTFLQDGLFVKVITPITQRGGGSNFRVVRQKENMKAKFYIHSDDVTKIARKVHADQARSRFTCLNKMQRDRWP